MEPATYHRSTHTPAHLREAGGFKKDNQFKQSFFGDSAQSETFFQPIVAVQRKCDKCEEEEKQVQKKDSGAGTNAVAAPAYVSSVSNSGSALPSALNAYFSSKMNHDFSNVKIHTGMEAENSAKQIHAQAYTFGDHIVFANGKYQPGTAEGRHLLAHELTHVTQQQGMQRKIQMSPDDESSMSNLAGMREDYQHGQNAGDSYLEEAAENRENESMEPVSLPDITTFGNPSHQTHFANSVSFQGKTDADFDGGTGQTSDLKGVPAKGCSGCEDANCMTITGKFTITYSVSTTVTLPDVPEGLTPCQAKRVKDAIDGTLAPHEQQHVAAFNTYNGKVTLPINYTGCKDGLEAHLQALNDSDGLTRKAAANAKSKALDPFFVSVDLDCQEPAPPAK